MIAMGYFLIFGLPLIIFFCVIWRQWGNSCYRKYEQRGHANRGQAIAILGPPAAVFVGYWLFIGVFHLTQVKALMGWFPARVTIDVSVADKPVKITRVYDCTQTLCFNDACFGRLRWVRDRHRIAEKLQTGGWLLLDLQYAPCSPDDFEKPVHRTQMPTIAWVDDIRAPTIIERYSLRHGPVSDYVAINPRIRRDNFTIRYERLSWPKANLDSLKDDEAIRWFSPGRHSGRIANTAEHLRIYSAIVAQVYPNVLASLDRDIATKLSPLSEPTPVSLTNNEIRKLNISLHKIANSVRSMESVWREHPPSQEEIRTLPYFTSFHYKSGNLWVFDTHNAGIEFMYFRGRSSAPPNFQSTWPAQTIEIGGRNFSIVGQENVFIPSTKTLVHVIGKSSISIP